MTNWPNIALPLLAGAAFVVAGACERVDPHQKALEIWESHAQVIRAAAAGEKVTEIDFIASSDFFYNLTEIGVPGTATFHLGWKPTEATKSALEPLDEWFRENRDRLYWDSAANEVVVRGK
jgi:hypothetical protein